MCRVRPRLDDNALDSSSREFVVQNLSVGFLRKLAGAIEGASRKENSAEDRSNAYQEAVVCRTHRGKNSSRDSHCAHEIDVHLMGYLLFRKAFSESDRHMTSIVYRDVDPPLFTEHLVDCNLN
jgi:hypothetical protein